VGPNAETLQEAFEGRELIELDFNSSASTLEVAELWPIDWFDDGSLYLLEAPDIWQITSWCSHARPRTSSCSLLVTAHTTAASST